jgi:serine/threonine-protein kinase
LLVPRFGAFEVDFATGEMRKSGVRVRVQEQPLRILQILLERPGELVTREELRARLWPANTFVDFERSLNAAVGKLRQSLNDSADRPLYVETVARKGYRFVAPVIESAPELLAKPQAEKPRSQSALPVWLRWAVAGASAGALGIFLWAASPIPRAGYVEHPVWLDLHVGNNVSQPAVSPDGMTLAFIAGDRLAVRRLDRATIRPLAGTEGATSPFFSPDGRWIGYFSNRKLRKVAVEGGESVTICDAPVDRGATWTDDGPIIASLSASGELSSVPASGGTPVPFSDLKGELPDVTDHRRPVALPGGKGILFVATRGVATGALRVLPPGGGAAKTLLEGCSTARYLASGYLLYYRGGTVFAAPMDLDRLELTGPASPLIEGVAHDHFRGADFDVSGSGTLAVRRGQPDANRAVAWLYSSGPGGRVFPETGAYATPRLSPDGKRLAVTSEAEIRIYDFAGKKMTPLTFGLAGQCCPVWSPDGHYVVFAAASALTWTRWDGTGPVERLPTPQGISAVPFSFSPDGKWLAIHQNSPQTGYDIWAAPAAWPNGVLRLGQPRPLVQQAGLQAAPAISPDGRWLAYNSDETGRNEVYVIPFSPDGSRRDGKSLVSTDGGRGARWSTSGDTLFFRSPDEHLMAASITTMGSAFQTDKPRLWSTQQLAQVGPWPSFDAVPDGERIVAVLAAGETEPDTTHLRILLNLNAEIGRVRANPQKGKSGR